MRYRNRGSTLINALVAIAIIGVLAAILIIYVRAQQQLSDQKADLANLQQLVWPLLSGSAQPPSKRPPRSAGVRFWLALVVGDGPGDGNLVIEGEDDYDIYLSAEDGAGLLISPSDGDRMDKDELRAELEAVVQAGTGVAGLSDPDRMCSYAGLVDPRTNISDRTAPIMGCTRGGIFSDGFSGVTTSAEARFYSYREMMDERGWPADTDTPLYGTAPLEHVRE